MTWHFWECPVCLWRILDKEYLFIKADLDCPGCGVRTLSEFQFVGDTEEGWHQLHKGVGE